MKVTGVFTNVDTSANIGENSQIWDFTQVRENVSIGQSCVIGRNVYIGPDVRIGNNCKIQNNSLIYNPAIIEDSVFIGPGAILTNDRNPRSINQDGTRKLSKDWDIVGIFIGEGASLGAGSICIAPIKIGKWSLIGAGSVVTRDVQNFALVVGNPARQIGWVGKSGMRLVKEGDRFVCPKTRESYILSNNKLFEANN